MSGSRTAASINQSFLNPFSAICWDARYHPRRVLPLGIEQYLQDTFIHHSSSSRPLRTISVWVSEGPPRIPLMLDADEGKEGVTWIDLFEAIYYRLQEPFSVTEFLEENSGDHSRWDMTIQAMSARVRREYQTNARSLKSMNIRPFKKVDTLGECCVFTGMRTGAAVGVFHASFAHCEPLSQYGSRPSSVLVPATIPDDMYSSTLPPVLDSCGAPQFIWDVRTDPSISLPPSTIRILKHTPLDIPPGPRTIEVFKLELFESTPVSCVVDSPTISYFAVLSAVYDLLQKPLGLKEARCWDAARRRILNEDDREFDHRPFKLVDRLDRRVVFAALEKKQDEIIDDKILIVSFREM